MTKDRSPSPDLEAANDLFHEAYGAVRDEVRSEVPTLLVLGDELVLRARGERLNFSYHRPWFDRAKSAAHVAVALFALSCDESWSEASDKRLKALLSHARKAAEALEREPSPSWSGELTDLLRTCWAFGETLPGGPQAAPGRDAFAREAGPRVLRITERATLEQIAGLDQAVDSALEQLSREELAQLQVVVVGDHQARARSLGMQYFQRRFREAEGAEDRVTYGENISSEAEALTLIGTKQLDKKIAVAFFGDAKRLQRDVLGDAAKACLERMDFSNKLPARCGA